MIFFNLPGSSESPDKGITESSTGFPEKNTVVTGVKNSYHEIISTSQILMNCGKVTAVFVKVVTLVTQYLLPPGSPPENDHFFVGRMTVSLVLAQYSRTPVYPGSFFSFSDPIQCFCCWLFTHCLRTSAS